MKKQILLLYIVGLIGCIAIPAVGQQAPSIQNIQNINVDDLSDAQIQKFVDRVQASGYTEDQLILLAKSRGMSALQIQKLRSRIDQLSVASDETKAGSISRIRSNPLGGRQDTTTFDLTDPFDLILVDPEADIPALKIFGLDLFRNSRLNFESSLNIPTPADYVLGPGDELIIDIWGASEQTYQVTISPEGNIRIPNLGPIYLNGLTIERAKSRVIYNLKKIYSTIGRSSKADVSLGQIRTISVHVIGRVMSPGTYQISSFGTVFNALYIAGGPTDKGSLRVVEIFRKKEKVATFDAYDFFIRGTGENTSLQDQDVIIIRPFENRVTITGEIKTPAIFELIDGETLEDLFYYAGGFTEDAFMGTFSVRRKENNYRTVKSATLAEAKTLVMQNGDALNIAPISNQFVGRVTIEGALLNPGEYEYFDGMKVSDLIKKAEGLRGDAFLKRAVIIREGLDLSLSSISFDPQGVLNGDTDVILMQNDVVKVNSIYDLREQYLIDLQGEVLKPGTIPYVEGMTVENLIFLGGGFKESAARSFVEVARRIDPDSAASDIHSAQIFNFSISADLSLSSEASKFDLAPFDLVVIRRNPFFNEQEIVEVEGEAKFPGKYVLEKKDERISDVLKRAGGLTRYAYTKGATLIRRTEYFVQDEFGGNDAAKLKRESLEAVLERDTSVVDRLSVELKQQESIGIRLDEIVNNPGSKYDMILKLGDIISIPKELQTVRIRGEVLYPSTIRQDNSFSFKEYISQAGGFSDNAKKNKSYIIYSNGSAARTKSFLWLKSYPKVAPGAEIIIPKKPLRNKLSTAELVAIMTALASMALVIDRLAQ